MSIACLNGEWQAIEDTRVSVLDRGFMFGDGVYEVIPVYRRRIFGEDEHLSRLNRSLGELHLTAPMSDDAWRALFQEAVQRGAEQDAIIYVQVTRGVAQTRSHAHPEVEPTVLVTLTAMPDRGKIRPLAVVTKEDIRWGRGDIKVISLAANGLLRNEAMAAGYDDAILIRNGKVTETTSSNVFVVKDGVIVTPPLSRFLLPGVTREQVITLVKQNCMRCEERDLDKSELYDADEIWISSTTYTIRPIGKVDDQPIGNGQAGPVYQKVYQLFQQKIHAASSTLTNHRKICDQ